MEYNITDIDKKWQEHWRRRGTYAVKETDGKPKYYVLDMFPYPSGAGLHVGHPLGYIASDIIARYMRHRGYNVLHPMGYDSFGLPAEQYAIQTGQHPAVTTEVNIARYREQLDKIGFSFDWDREVRTSDPDYYRWTQWIFSLIYDSWYNKNADRAEPIHTLVAHFEANGNYNVNAAIEEDWYRRIDLASFGLFRDGWQGDFTATDWSSMNEVQQQQILMHYRLAYLSDSVVNWCPALGTVLANDEIKDGVSERGGHPVEQKMMRQWSMRISAYAERLLTGLETIDWPENIKEIQRNWIGRSEGAMVSFEVDGHDAAIDVFTTRPDTIFGVSFMTLAPEHELVDRITTPEYRDAVDKYVASAKLKTERDRQADVKQVSGQFTGAYALHPFTGEKIPVWIGEYVLAGYGTGAVMAVPAGDQRDYDFAKKFNLPIPPIFAETDLSEKAETSKEAILANSDFLNGLSGAAAMRRVIEELEKRGIGQGRVNYRMRDAVFSRQRYWGEPIPIYYKDETPYLVNDDDLPLNLPAVDKYLPTESGEPPLARAANWSYEGHRLEYNTMPGWAGSSWYFLRYMDPHNEMEFVSKEKMRYWGQVDLYMGGAEHATGHLLYSRFWTKVLYDLGYIGFEEPFKKMINQGMIGAYSCKVWCLRFGWTDDQSPSGIALFHRVVFISGDVAAELMKLDVEERKEMLFERLKSESWFDGMEKFIGGDITHFQFGWNYMNISKAELDSSRGVYSISWESVPGEEKLRIAGLPFIEGNRIEEDVERHIGYIHNSKGEFVSASVENEKMSKSKFNVQTPDELVEKFGADTLRCYEMFLGPVEQSKPWDTKGINGVHNFLRRFWRLFHDGDNHFVVSDVPASKEELRVVHKTIKKVTDDLGRYSWNTVVSSLMIAVNELTDLKCRKREALEPLCILLSPYAPHIASELWSKLGHSEDVVDVEWPVCDESLLVDDAFEYPVSFNGKTRFFISLPVEMKSEEVQAAVLAHESAAKYLEGKMPKKVIVVPKRIVNVVV